MSHAHLEPAMHHPELIVLDVNETLSDLSPMSRAFTDVGLKGHELEAWFAGVLRDAFALTVLGNNPSLADIAAVALHVRLAAAGVAGPDHRAREVMGRFASLASHPDILPGLRALADAGCRIVTLSDGSADVARNLLEGTTAGSLIEEYLAVSDAGAWKPARAAYEHALATASVEARRAMLVAVHPWDIAGAHAAGLRTAWINRDGARYPSYLPTADVEVASLVEPASTLLR